MHAGVLVPRSTGKFNWSASIQRNFSEHGEWDKIFEVNDKVGSHKALHKVLDVESVKKAIGVKLTNPKLYMQTVEMKWIEIKESEGPGESNALDLEYVPKYLEFVIADENVSPSTRRGGGQGGSPAAVGVPSALVMLHRLRPLSRTSGR
eukprot:GHVU01005878.1.p1 GENE.GHVU01005878.1~~GHVU01005878.1.p1  ORF type:complete len:149 (+),score=9.87 GHVU01005878.1:102-548(+)